MAAEHLLRLHSVLETKVGEDALEHGRQQAEAIFRDLARRRVL
jgi:hypothetical protein